MKLVVGGACTGGAVYAECEYITATFHNARLQIIFQAGLSMEKGFNLLIDYCCYLAHSATCIQVKSIMIHGSGEQKKEVMFSWSGGGLFLLTFRTLCPLSLWLTLSPALTCSSGRHWLVGGLFLNGVWLLRTSITQGPTYLPNVRAR